MTEEQQQKQRRFKFPDDGAAIESGVVRGVPAEMGDLVASSLARVVCEAENLNRQLLGGRSLFGQEGDSPRSRSSSGGTAAAAKKWCDRCNEGRGCWTEHDTEEHRHVVRSSGGDGTKQQQSDPVSTRFIPPAASRQQKKYGTVQFRFAAPAPLDAIPQIEIALKEELVRRGVSEEDHNLRRINVQAGRTELSASSKGTGERGTNTACPHPDEEEGPLVVDTDDVSRIFKGDSRSMHLEKILGEHRGRKMISFQTQAELFAWIMQTGFSHERRHRLEQLLADFEVVWPDDNCSLIWANLMNQRRAVGRPAGAQDMWVAATAIRQGAKLCTANIKDYDYLPQLQLLPVFNTVTRELHIQKYLREGGKNESTWNKLRESVSVVRSKVHPSLLLLDVKMHAATDDPGNRAYGCRGLILDEADDYRIVNYPFNSFFSLGARQSRGIAKKLDWSSCTIFPKLDGTLICLYYYGNGYRVSTRGHPDASSSVLENDRNHEGMSFMTLFWKTWKELGYNLPPPHGPWIRRTYCFELLTPENRVVVPVEKPRIVLTMVRDLDTLEEMPCNQIASELHWDTILPETPVSGPDELRARADSLSPVQGEGYVVVDPTWARLKVKSRRYVLAANLPRPNWGWKDHQSALAAVDDAQVLKLVLAGESEEFAAYFPEWSSRFLEMQAKLNRLVDELGTILGDALLQSGRTIKDVHLHLRDRHLPSGLTGILMKALKNQLYGGEILVMPERGRLLEILSEEKPVKVLFWSDELAKEKPASAPAAPACLDDRKSFDVQQEETADTHSWAWRPYFAFAFPHFSVFTAVLAVIVAYLTRVWLPQIHIAQQAEYSVLSFLVVFVTGVCAGYNAELIQGRRLSSKFATWRQSSNLPKEMKRLAALHENSYSVDTLSRMAILEGFLRRLSRSTLKHSLVLRGSLLTRQIVRPLVRVANDLDFVAVFPWNESDPVCEVLSRIRAICDLPESDGVSFGDSSSISGEVIWGESRFPGVKVSLSSASLYGQQCPKIEIDVGFNDPLDPPPIWIQYQALPLFQASKSFCVLSVRPELLFAWKLHGLFEHNTINELGQDIQGYWRMKDIHDLWLMTRAFTSGSREGIPVELKYISLAVEVAFASREQDPRLIQRVISRDFGCSTGSKRRWKSYRNKAPCPDELPAQLHTIVDEIVEFIEPLLKEMLQRRGGLERIVQEGSSTSAPDIQAPASSVEPLDTTAMISELPGGWNVLRNQAKVEFEDVGFEEVQELLKGPTNNLMFGDRSEQYDVALVKPSKGTRRGFVTLKQAPPFTMRSCTAYLVARRVPVQSPSNANIPHSTHVVTGREELQKPRSSAELEFDKAEIPQNEAEKGAFEAGKHLLANRLARRLDVLPPLQTLVFVTSSQAKYLEAKKCLAEWQDLFVQGPPSVKPPSPSPRSSFWRGPESAVRSMARYCFDILQTPCLVDFTFLEVAEPSGGAPLLYSSSDINDLGSVDNFLETNYGRSATLRSFLGYLSSNSGRVLLFEGSLEGHIRSATSADADDGAPSLKIPAKVPMDNRDQSTHLHDFMETVFVPEGYAQPLINMSESSFCLGVRHVPLLELAQSLRGRDYSQLFEVHVTVETPEVPGAMLRFEEHCADLSQFGFPIPVKPVLIENASGEVPTQMMTSSYHRGTLSDVHLQSFRLSQALVRAGYVVSRTKIEALLSSRGVPVTDTEAQRLSPENYFEFHIKLRLPGDCPLEPLRMLAERHGARLSRNALSKSVQTSSAGEVVESWQRRFVNLRLYQVGRDTALERFQACVEDLEQSGYAIEKLIREYSVYDSNVALDRGWIDRHATASAKS